MNIEEVRVYCLSRPCATEDVPFGAFDSEDVAFRVCGKIFAFLLVDDSRMVVLKCAADKAIELREKYVGVIEPAFHWNKKYWNQVHYDSLQLTPDMIKLLIDDSYNEVVKKLTKKQRTELENNLFCS